MRFASILAMVKKRISGQEESSTNLRSFGFVKLAQRLIKRISIVISANKFTSTEILISQTAKCGSNVRNAPNGITLSARCSRITIQT
jgi:hypothetical protein